VELCGARIVLAGSGNGYVKVLRRMEMKMGVRMEMDIVRRGGKKR
jgi:hypothetical protein